MTPENFSINALAWQEIASSEKVAGFSSLL
jgi:hypothetical protein